MRMKHTALLLTAGFLLLPTLLWSQFPGGFGGAPGGPPGGPGGFGGGPAGPGGGGPGGFGGGGRSMMMQMDPDMAFNMLSGGKDVIQVDQLDPRMKGMIDRFGSLVGLSGNSISRDQFKQAMTKVKEMAASGQFPSGMSFRTPGGGPGGSPDSDRRLEEMFKRMDQNENGVLEFNEMSETLQSERDKYDTNHNGVIELDEFKAYVAARYAPRPGDNGPGAGPRLGPGESSPAEEEERIRPTLIRAGNLPRDFPFAALDRDGDGQIGLYEWKEAGRRIADFLPMDLNNDGFVTVDEYFRWKKQGDELAMKNGSGSGDMARGGRGRFGPGAGMPGMGDGVAMNGGRFAGMGMPGMNNPMGMNNWQGFGGPRGDGGGPGGDMMGFRGPRGDRGGPGGDTMTFRMPGGDRGYGMTGMGPGNWGGSTGMNPGNWGGGGMGQGNWGGGTGMTPGMFAGNGTGRNFAGMTPGTFDRSAMMPGGPPGGSGFTMPVGPGAPTGTMPFGRGDASQGPGAYGDRGPGGGPRGGGFGGPGEE